MAKQGTRQRFRLITGAYPPSAIFEIIYIDLVQVAVSDTTKSYGGHTHILTVCDRLSRFCRFIPIRLAITKQDKKRLAQLEKALDRARRKKDLQTKDKLKSEMGNLHLKRASVIVATKLMKEIFLRLHKVPKVIVADNGSEFHNALLKRMTKLLGVQLRFTAPLNPRANFVERIHRPLGAMLRAAVNNHALFPDTRNWDQYIAFIEHRLNEYKPNGQEFSPAQIVLGRVDSLSAPLLRKFSISTADAQSAPSTAETRVLEQYAEDLVSFQKYVEKWLTTELLGRQEDAQARFNKKMAYSEYVKGDKVAVYNKRIGSRVAGGLPTKLILQWSGPATIVKKIGPQLYKVRLSEGGREVKITTDRLKPLCSDLMMPAEPKTLWTSSFPRSGADLILLPGDQVVVLEIPKHLLSGRGKQRIDESPFYVAEFIQYDDSVEGSQKVKLLMKGSRDNSGEKSSPFESKYRLAWKLNTSAARAAKRNEEQIVFGTKNPKAEKYEPVEIVARSSVLLPMYAFNLTKQLFIPKQVQQNIKILLQHRVANATEE